ncbi:MAG: hypothetical protein AAF638_05720 [Pseudomonadota bacterium]
MQKILLILAGVLFAAVAAFAEDAPADGDARSELGPRFQLEQRDGITVRLDTRTGTVSRCVETGGQLVCRAAIDDRSPFEDQIARLEAENAELKARMAAISSLLQAETPVPDTVARDGDLPSDDEIDRTLDVMEKTLRRFMGMADDLRKDMEALTEGQ